MSDALKAAVLSLPKLARLSKVRLSTLKHFSAGTREPSQEQQRAIGKALRLHAEQTAAFADRLDPDGATVRAVGRARRPQGKKGGET